MHICRPTPAQVPLKQLQAFLWELVGQEGVPSRCASLALLSRCEVRAHGQGAKN